MVCSARAEVAAEYQIKAAFLYNFTKFVEWPAELFPTEDAPLNIGVFGRNPFGDELEKLVRDRTVNGHRIAVVYLQSGTDLKSASALCHVLFVGGSDAALFARLPPPPAGSGRLTVGESTIATKGVVTFVIVDSKVRFEIDADAAHYAGLKISSQLQKLATVVHRKF